MNQGILFALAFGAFVVVVIVGFVRRSRTTRAANVAGDSPPTVAQWTEGETTRLLVVGRAARASTCCDRVS